MSVSLIKGGMDVKGKDMELCSQLIAKAPERSVLLSLPSRTLWSVSCCTEMKMDQKSIHFHGPRQFKSELACWAKSLRSFIVQLRVQPPKQTKLSHLALHGN